MVARNDTLDRAPEERSAVVEPLVFKPKPSLGWVWWVALSLLVVASGAAPLASAEVRAETPPIIWIMMVGIAALGVWFLVIAVFFPSMRYEMADRELVLRYGPLLAYRVPYASIAEVRRTDLVPSLWSSMRVPGLALWKVPYGGIGTVQMCSTRMQRGVLLVTTADGTHFGMSPAEEERFVDTLTARIADAQRARA